MKKANKQQQTHTQLFGNKLKNEEKSYLSRKFACQQNQGPWGTLQATVEYKVVIVYGNRESELLTVMFAKIIAKI